MRHLQDVKKRLQDQQKDLHVLGYQIKVDKPFTLSPHLFLPLRKIQEGLMKVVEVRISCYLAEEMLYQEQLTLKEEVNFQIHQ